MKRATWGFGSALLLMSASSAASGVSFSRVALLLGPCEQPGLGVAELREAVRLELAAEGLTLAPLGELSSEMDALVRVDLDCSEQPSALLAAEAGSQRRERRLMLAEVPQSQRARALSLALAELLATFASGPPSSPVATATEAPEGTADAAPPATAAAAIAAPAGAVRSAPGRDAPRTPRPAAPRAARPVAADSPGIELGLAPELRLFDGTTLLGAQATLSRSPWCVGGNMLLDSTQVPAGKITTLLAQVSFAYDQRLLGARDGLSWGAGPRMGAGFVAFLVNASAPARGASALDLYFDAALRTWLVLGAGPFGAVLGGEVGYARGPAGRADGVEVTRTHGPFFGMWLGGRVEP